MQWFYDDDETICDTAGRGNRWVVDDGDVCLRASDGRMLVLHRLSHSQLIHLARVALTVAEEKERKRKAKYNTHE